MEKSEQWSSSNSNTQDYVLRIFDSQVFSALGAQGWLGSNNYPDYQGGSLFAMPFRLKEKGSENFGFSGGKGVGLSFQVKSVNGGIDVQVLRGGRYEPPSVFMNYFFDYGKCQVDWDSLELSESF